MPLLVLLFLIIPIVEVFLLIQVGRFIGPWWTIALVILTAVLGSILLRMEGLATLFRLRQTLARGELPAFEVLEGGLLLIGGALLLTPGFFTDAIGFICLLPYTRRPLIRWLLAEGIIAIAVPGQQRRHHGGRHHGGRHHGQQDLDDHIEAPYRRLDDD